MDRKPALHLDFESRSVLPFAGKDGVSVSQYSQHWGTEIWLLRYAIDGGPVQAWDPWHYDKLPQDLVDWVVDGGIVAAHNATFEWLMWNNIMVPRYGAPPLPFEQTDDTAVRASIMALPRSLGDACLAMGVPVNKDKEGQALMKRMAKPRKVHDYRDSSVGPDEWADFELEAALDPMKYTVHPTERIVYEWWSTSERFERLGAYCDVDVEAERALDHALIPLPDINRRDMMLVHNANMHGVTVDVELARRASAIMECASQRYIDRLIDLTDGEVDGPTKVAPMRRWLAEKHGIETESLDKAHVAALLERPEFQDKSYPPRQLLEIRQAAGKSSVAKLKRFIQLSDDENVMRENFMYHGAATGRLSGKGAQLQNLPSKTGLGWEQAELAVELIHRYGADAEGALDMLELIFGDVPETISSTLRSHITAGSGNALYVADFSNIEGRVAAWFGGEAWKLQAFRQYDTVETDGSGNPIWDSKAKDWKRCGPDLYKVTAGEILGISPWSVDKTQRNVLGKVPELALGFEGGVGAFQSMAKLYRVNMADYWGVIQAALDDRFISKAHDHWDLFGKKSGIDRDEWLASETVKVAWRAKHPGIASCWKACYEAAVKALQNPGRWQVFANGKLAFGSKVIAGVPFLIGRLPSGRCIFKAHAKLKMATSFGRQKLQIQYKGVDSVTRRWVPMTTYSGDLFQSFVQATAADMMMHGWENVQNAPERLDVRLSVHDELGAVGKPGISVERFEQLMQDMPPWAEGCPVAAAGYVSYRYKKD